MKLALLCLDTIWIENWNKGEDCKFELNLLLFQNNVLCVQTFGSEVLKGFVVCIMHALEVTFGITLASEFILVYNEFSTLLFTTVMNCYLIFI